MLSRFFIDRPVFSWVIALLIMGAGALAVVALPVQQYPEIAPPQVTISATYPGASAETLENTVTQVIEQNLTGIDNLRYFTSTSSSSGTAQITLTFDTGTDPDIAQVQTQNRLAQALPSLPAQVQQLGIPVTKSSGTFLMVVAFYSESGDMSQIDISDFVASNVVDPVSRVEGVGQVRAFGPEHAMRIWLDPDKMLNYKITTLEVIDAIRAENNQLATGQIGGQPTVEGQQINATIIAQTLMETPEEFEQIILRTLPNGSSVRLKDVARVEIGSENYGSIRRFNRKNAAGFGVSLAAGANALETIQAVKERIKEFEPTFPSDLKASYPVDVAPFIKTSMWEVVRTLGLAMILVLAVMYVFLQSLRATLIPGIAIPVVLLGTAAGLSIFGYSINILTMFALVLSIGMLVDDAIVVTENIKRSLENDSDISPKEAAKKSMKELTGALIGTTVVLWAVFTPMIFFGGSTGVIYRQFSVTIISAMTLSLFIALTFAPSLAATVIKGSKSNGSDSGSKEKRFSFFRGFNKAYDRTSLAYEKAVRWLLCHVKTAIALFIAILVVTAGAFIRIPETFLPDEDQGRVFALIQGPANSTFDRTMETVKKVEDFFLTESKDIVTDLFAVAGFSFSGQGQNTAITFVQLAPFEERKGEDDSVAALTQRANKTFSSFRNASVFTLSPPPIAQLGNATGFEFQLVDRGGVGHEGLVNAKNALLTSANRHPLLSSVRMNALEDNPQYQLNLDRQKARALGVSTPVMNSTLSAAWGGSYVNDFVEKGRVKRVFIQGEASSRMKPEDIGNWYARGSSGEMVSFKDFASGRWSYGSPQLQRFNGQPSYQIQGEAAAGASTGEAMEAILDLMDQLPEGVNVEWTGLSFEERQAGAQVFVLYSISIVAIFLSLAALYESWAIPFSLILVLPLGVFGAALATWLMGESNDVYFKVGILLTMGLAAKNAILIVEFARNIHGEGKSAFESAVQACRQRFRPILMTSFTFVLGVLPMVFASGPGAGAQNSIGTGLVGGITSTTALVIFFAPVFFVGVVKLTERRRNES